MKSNENFLTGVSLKPGKKRIEIIDALRGFALFGILLIHGVEHFNFFHRPDQYYLFSREFDSFIRDAVFFMVSQKAYSIFALMFGVSFYIQMSNQKNRGGNFNLRFAWRLTILLLLGVLHTFIYNGDILMIYAVLGYILIPINRLNTKMLWILAILFALQIPFIYHLIMSFLNSDYEYSRLRPLITYNELREVYTNSGFPDVVKMNIIKGKSRSIAWSYNTGRLYQLVSLFIVGLIAGRKKIFYDLGQNLKPYLIVLITGLFFASGIWILVRNLPVFNLTDLQTGLLRVILNSYYNLAFTFCLIVIFIITYILIPKGKLFRYFAIYGRMSLTNYLFQTVIGAFFFYGYGLAMYKYMGYTWGFIYGFLFFILQVVFSTYWLNRYYYGPVEWLWRALTLLDFKLRFRRKS